MYKFDEIIMRNEGKPLVILTASGDIILDPSVRDAGEDFWKILDQAFQAIQSLQSKVEELELRLNTQG